jgi:hypothetical protein
MNELTNHNYQDITTHLSQTVNKVKAEHYSQQEHLAQTAAHLIVARVKIVDDAMEVEEANNIFFGDNNVSYSSK